jgi:hypothetical protein
MLNTEATKAKLNVEMSQATTPTFKVQVKMDVFEHPFAHYCSPG